MLTFFGLTPEYKVELHKQLFSLITYGKGGWTWDALYNQIPVYLRNFYLNELRKSLEKEAESYESIGKEKGKIVGPPVLPKS